MAPFASKIPRMLGAAVALPLALLPFYPLYNPDLFWHLSAGRWIVANRAVPRADFLSFTLGGAPWVDFEWLTQLIYYAIYSHAGIAGLWALKIGLLALAAVWLLKTLDLYGIEGFSLVAALALWSAGMLAHSDIRPDLFSAALFSWLLFSLESLRLSRARVSPSALAGLFAVFSLWANLHGGFAFGLMLISFYAAAALARRQGYDPGNAGAVPIGLLAVSSAAGTLLNPYGIGPYRVIYEHWQLRSEVIRLIQEWQPISLSNLFHWPFWPAAAVGPVLLLLRLKDKRLPLGLIGATIYLAYGGASHARLASYFNILAVPLIFLLARDCGWLAGKMPRAAVIGALAASLYMAYMACVLVQLPWRGLFNDTHVPPAVVEFLQGEKAVLKELRVFHPWQWGGFLGFRLHPWFKVYSDGRYIFHRQTAEFVAAAAASKDSPDFLLERNFNGALVRNSGDTAADRPWYAYSLPQERWALVYWDPQALFFVDRSQVPKDWLDAHEYRHVRPGGQAALAAAVARREVSGRVKEEERRHALEMTRFWSSRGVR